MPTHAEVRTLPYTPEQMFDLVADIEKYPEFLPWCRAARVWKREGDVLHADLVIGYKLFQERFTSRVTLKKARDGQAGHIHVEYIKGPMKHLNNHWRFLPSNPDHCCIDFFVDFEFRNPVFQKLMGVFFNEIVKRMVAAFEARACTLYESE
ncbi:MAG: type II toxin-antitoxin system RatA family toxin [Proteobacteria bacterium]|nr:type II toxin-antitoxin system RatA family toxin [Pseudomonadota bacterium]